MKLTIKGHPERGNKVIKILEMLGGYNANNHYGNHCDKVYYINENGYIDWDFIFRIEQHAEFIIFSLEEFEEKYPYKVGDKVTLYNKLCSIIWMCWECNNIYYQVQGIGDVFTKKVTTDELNPYKDEAHMEDNKLFGTVSNPDGIKSYTVNKETNINKDNHCEIDENQVFGYKVDDVIFTNDTGWIRITNKLWNCYAKEHVYEGIGIINEIKYKNIRHHNVTGKLQLGNLKYSNNADGVRHVNSITDDIMINQITNKVSVIELKPDVCDNEIELKLGNYDIKVRDGKTYAILKKPTYPKTYKECCKIMKIHSSYELELCGRATTQGEITNCVYAQNLLKKINKFQQLLICRDAYWKIAGEQMGLDKPWKPDWHDCTQRKFGLYTFENGIRCINLQVLKNIILTFPTEEMRDSFYENFKELIEQCKELL